MTTKGKLIVIEGADGIGKTTLIQEMKEHHKSFYYYREPGGHETCEQIRNQIFQLSDVSTDTDKLFMFHASRIILWYNEIKPLLDAGRTVVLDRFYLSTIIYENCLGEYDKIIHELLKDYKDNILNIVLTTDIIHEETLNKRENSFDDKYDKAVINEKYCTFLSNLDNSCNITKYNYTELKMKYYENTNKSIMENYNRLNEIIQKFIGGK